MRKFAKVSLIIAVVCMLTGIVIYIIGFAGGGQTEVNRMVKNGELSYFEEYFDAPKAPKAPKAPNAPGKTEKSDVATTSAVMEESGEASLASEEIVKLDIELGGGELYIETGDVEQIQITSNCDDEFESYVEDNTFYIKGFDLKDNFFDWINWEENKNSVHVIIPKEMVFTATDISLGAGIIEISNMNLGETDMEIGAGELKCNNTKSEQLTVELGAGAVYMEKIEAGETDISVAMGEAVLKGIINQDLDLQCSMGSIEAELDGTKEEFNYSVEAAMGSVEIDGDSYDGIAAEKKVDNGADKTIHAETSMGDIEIVFTK